MYLFVVRIPVIWATIPGVGDTSWSTDTQSPGFVSCITWYSFLFLSLHFRLVAFAYKHALHVGIGQLINFLPMMPCLAISINLLKLMWPYLWCKSRSSADIFSLSLWVLWSVPFVSMDCSFSLSFILKSVSFAMSGHAISDFVGSFLSSDMSSDSSSTGWQINGSLHSLSYSISAFSQNKVNLPNPGARLNVDTLLVVLIGTVNLCPVPQYNVEFSWDVLQPYDDVLLLLIFLCSWAQCCGLNNLTPPSGT